MCLDAPNAPSGSTLSGASTFITSAPQSASCLTAVGPDLTLVRSITLICDNASDAGKCGISCSPLPSIFINNLSYIINY